MAGTNSERIRKPGEPFELSDDEILAAPPKLLSFEQRKRRRRLKNNAAKDRTRSRRAAAKRGEPQPHGTKIKFCQGTTKKGGKCEAYAVEGAKHCVNHFTDEEKERLGVIRNTTNGLKRTASPVALAREVTEVATAKVIQPYFDAIGVEFVGFDEEGKPVVREKGDDSGLMLHGESKDGYIHMSRYPDIGGRIAAMEKLQDRVYGRPRQTTVLEGGVRPIQVEPIKTVERSQTVFDIMRRTGMLESAPEPVPEPPPGVIEGTATREGELIPLRSGDNESDQR